MNRIVATLTLIAATLTFTACVENTEPSEVVVYTTEVVSTNLIVTVIHTNANGDVVYTAPKLLFEELIGVDWTDIDYPGYFLRINADGTFTNWGGYYNASGSVVFTNAYENYFILRYDSHDGVYGTNAYGLNFTNRYTKMLWQNQTWTNQAPVWNGMLVRFAEIVRLVPSAGGFDTITEATNASPSSAWYTLYRETR